MIRPLVLTITGAAIGLAAVLPLARTQIEAATADVGVQVSPVPGQSGSASGSTQVTATGPTIGTRYGPVQVKVTVTGTKLTAATAVQLPDGDGESRQISAAAGPRCWTCGCCGTGSMPPPSPSPRWPSWRSWA